MYRHLMYIQLIFLSCFCITHTASFGFYRDKDVLFQDFLPLLPDKAAGMAGNVINQSLSAAPGQSDFADFRTYPRWKERF